MTVCLERKRRQQKKVELIKEMLLQGARERTTSFLLFLVIQTSHYAAKINMNLFAYTQVKFCTA